MADNSSFPTPETSPELIDYAANDAARGLIQNWGDTLRDDPSFSNERMVGDIDQVIEALQAWREKIRVRPR